MMKQFLFCCGLVFLCCPFALRAEDGYRLWLRYDRVADEAQRAAYTSALGQIVLATPTGADSATIKIARDELTVALDGLLGIKPTITLTALPATNLGGDGYSLQASARDGHAVVVISGQRDIGVLYGSFALLRLVQTGGSLEKLSVTSVPKVQRRLLNHWDNLNGFIERGYAGFSLWKWFYLPGYLDPRYTDYARACASIGINGAVLTNVNANALVLTPHYLVKVAALADVFRPYGVRVYLPARFSAPIEIGGLKTADPLDPAVAAWWKKKTDEIYSYVPDFGGFLVKANSEGQPGPQDYHRTHADGANMLADALQPHGGIVMWRAFVYAADNTEDRVKQAYHEFMPLDGQFRDNVVLQIKNGPLDFMPREPFHPLFGGMKKTPLALELQITQEYLGGSTQLAFLAPLYKEVLNSETFAEGPGSTVARVIDGSLYKRDLSVMAGVANTGGDRNWTGHPLAQANWYAFGRLAWDNSLASETIAGEWTRMTYGHDPMVVDTIDRMLLGSREMVVNYSMPLGLHHIMAEGHHYGPGPWEVLARADWSPPYYHQADAEGLGANRGPTGSKATETYAPELATLWGDPDTCPEKFLLWFNHVAWDHKMKSGRTLWDELALHYQEGVDGVRTMQHEWDSLEGKIDAERFVHVQSLLKRQEADARDWRDACLLYFQTFSKQPLPAGVEAPAHDLAYYKAVKLRYVPGHPGDY
ncbi:MAG TPA: alpha-glucuronidase family glycosyl hydrolase [Lacunisphaera sp.]|jgi:alpha-glucuronidase